MHTWIIPETAIVTVIIQETIAKFGQDHVTHLVMPLVGVMDPLLTTVFNVRGTHLLMHMAPVYVILDTLD